MGEGRRNCLWKEAAETASTGGWVARVRNMALTGIARYVWVRCIIGQSINGKINSDRGGYGFSSYWEEVLVDCQNINILNEVQAPLKSVRVSPTSAGLKFNSLCFINCFGRRVVSENVKIQIGWYKSSGSRFRSTFTWLNELKQNTSDNELNNGTVRSNIKRLQLEVALAWSSDLARDLDTRYRSSL